MRRDDGQGFRKQAPTKIEEKCGRLTDQARVERYGHRDQLLGRLPVRTGPLTDAIKRELWQWQHQKARPVAECPAGRTCRRPGDCMGLGRSPRLDQDHARVLPRSRLIERANGPVLDATAGTVGGAPPALRPLNVDRQREHAGARAAGR